MNERLKQIRKHYKLTLDEFGKRLGVTKTAISRLEKGERNITEQMFLSICREFNANAEWLRTGEGEMFLNFSENDELAAAISEIMEDTHCENSFSTLIKEILIQHERLDEKAKNHVDEFFDNVLNGLAEKKEGN